MMAEREPYEALTASIAMIDAALELLGEICFEERRDLNDIRNGLNRRRVALLGNGRDRPFNVDDLNLIEAGEVEYIVS